LESRRFKSRSLVLEEVVARKGKERLLTVDQLVLEGFERTLEGIRKKMVVVEAYRSVVKSVLM
jgi:hypothetical protein